MGITLSVFFEGPFWVGLLECNVGGRLTAARVVFGAEPSDAQVYDWVLAHYCDVRFSPPVEGARQVRLADNPKRRQRQAAKLQPGAGTRSQQALQLAREAAAAEHKARAKEKRAAEELRKFRLRVEKKKSKHRGR